MAQAPGSEREARARLTSGPEMGPDRRGFLRLVAGALAALSAGAWGARTAPGALEVHRATRNPQRGRARTRATPRPVAFKSYPGTPRTGLPRLATAPSASLADAVRGGAPARAFRKGELSPAQLGRLLYLANGMTGRDPDRGRSHGHRAAPSAGALYGGELYVLAERVRGLPPGLYYYDVRGHALARLRSGSFLEETGRALEEPEILENAAAIVLVTNVFWRYMRRYRERGYRYALLDTGHITENLRLALRSEGLVDAHPLRFHDDRLNALLQVDGREEAVCALQAVGFPDEGAERPRPGARHLVEKGDRGERELPPDAPVSARYHEATKLVPGDEAEARGAPAPWRHASGGSGIPLPPSGAPPARSVERAIRRRCSARRFARKPVSRADLGFVLEMARGNAALERAPGVDLHLVVNAVQDLDRGLYRYDARAHGLVPARKGDLRGPLTRACLRQEHAGRAAVGFLMVGRLQEAASRAGERSYRDLLLEAGAIGQRIYLAAGALGLGARNLSAFTDDELNTLLGWDGRREAALHLTLLGRLASEAA